MKVKIKYTEETKDLKNYVTEINTLEELIALKVKENHHLILLNNTLEKEYDLIIEVYNDYRE